MKLQSLGVITSHSPHDNALDRRGQRGARVAATTSAMCCSGVRVFCAAICLEPAWRNSWFLLYPPSVTTSKECKRTSAGEASSPSTFEVVMGEQNTAAYAPTWVPTGLRPWLPLSPHVGVRPVVRFVRPLSLRGGRAGRTLRDLDLDLDYCWTTGLPAPGCVTVAGRRVRTASGAPCRCS